MNVYRAALFSLPLIFAAGSVSRGQPEAASSSSMDAPLPETEAAPDSPRASIEEYLGACRAGRYEAASKYLDLGPGQESAGPELARQLKAVLDRRLWIDASLVSALPEGDTKDGLTAGTERLGVIVNAGRSEPVRLVRREDPDQVRWVFSRGTVARIPTWYSELDDAWAREYLPEALLRPGPRELLWWQWLALAPLITLAWAIGRLLTSALCRVLARVTSRTQSQWDDRLISRLSGPIHLAFSLVMLRVLLVPLSLYAPAEIFVTRVLWAIGLLSVFWCLWRIVDVAAEGVRRTPWVQRRPSSRSMLDLGERFGKVAVVAIGVIAALSELGYPVASLVAGLGLGGLAFALAAQKTVENLFGSVSLAADEPFRIGDFVGIENFVGTIEAIGLRSTRIRTLDRTLISIPNGRLADMRVESYTARDRMRLACTIGLVYSTRAAQLRQVLERLEAVLRSHPKIWQDSVVVRFKEIATSSLDIEIMAWFQTPDWNEFQLIRQDVLIQFMEVVEKAGSAFAFPTQTIQVERPPMLSTP